MLLVALVVRPILSVAVSTIECAPGARVSDVLSEAVVLLALAAPSTVSDKWSYSPPVPAASGSLPVPCTETVVVEPMAWTCAPLAGD